MPHTIFLLDIKILKNRAPKVVSVNVLNAIVFKRTDHFCPNMYKRTDHYCPNMYKGENLRHDHLCFKRK